MFSSLLVFVHAEDNCKRTLTITTEFIIILNHCLISITLLLFYNLNRRFITQTDQVKSTRFSVFVRESSRIEEKKKKKENKRDIEHSRRV